MTSTAKRTDEKEDTGSFQVEPPARQRVADHVFETLARAIFSRDLQPGEPLPTQRELAKRFKISALVVRQAIHRLEDMGLVRVRQGSTTTVLDPEESTDIRLIQLRMQLADPTRNLASDAFENQLLFTVPMLVLAERRITEEELAVLDYIVDSVDRSGATDEDGRRFRIEYWRQISKATHNTMFQAQVRWWSSMIEQLDASGKDYGPPRGQVMVEFFRGLNERLRRGEGTVEYYLSRMQPIFDWADRQRGVTPRGSRAAGAGGSAATSRSPAAAPSNAAADAGDAGEAETRSDGT